MGLELLYLQGVKDGYIEVLKALVEAKVIKEYEFEHIRRGNGRTGAVRMSFNITPIKKKRGWFW